MFNKKKRQQTAEQIAAITPVLEAHPELLKHIYDRVQFFEAELLQDKTIHDAEEWLWDTTQELNRTLLARWAQQQSERASEVPRKKGVHRHKKKP